MIKFLLVLIIILLIIIILFRNNKENMRNNTIVVKCESDNNQHIEHLEQPIYLEQQPEYQLEQQPEQQPEQITTLNDSIYNMIPESTPMPIDQNVELMTQNDLIVPGNNVSEIPSMCNLLGEDLLVEQCLISSRGKFMDDFINCLNVNGVSKKISDNFSPLQYGLLLKDLDNGKSLDCEKFMKTLNNAKQ